MQDSRASGQTGAMDEKAFAVELRKWWSFDGRQQHTHSWHSREDFIAKRLPSLIRALRAVLPALSPPAIGDGEMRRIALLKGALKNAHEVFAAEIEALQHQILILKQNPGPGWHYDGLHSIRCEHGYTPMDGCSAGCHARALHTDEKKGG